MKINHIKFYTFLLSKEYDGLSDSARILYSIFRDKMEHNYYEVDEDGNKYIIFYIQNIKKLLGWYPAKICKIKKELQRYGLIQNVQVGKNDPNRIYL